MIKFNDRDYDMAEDLIREQLYLIGQCSLEEAVDANKTGKLPDNAIERMYIMLSSFASSGHMKLVEHITYCTAAIASDMKQTLRDRCIEIWGGNFYETRIVPRLLNDVTISLLIKSYVDQHSLKNKRDKRHKHK